MAFAQCPVKLGGGGSLDFQYCKCQLPLGGRSGLDASSTKRKIGSRAIRLSVSERRAYDLARKKGYLMRYTRSQPLANVYHNYCDKVGWPYIYIHQEAEGKKNRVVIDLRTLRLPQSELEELCTLVVQALRIPKVNYPCATLEIAKEIAKDIPFISKMEETDQSVDEEAKLHSDEAGSGLFSGTPGDDNGSDTTLNEHSSLVSKGLGTVPEETSLDLSKIKGILCFQGTVNQTKTMCEVSLHTCKAFLPKKGIQLAKTWWKEPSNPAANSVV